MNAVAYSESYTGCTALQETLPTTLTLMDLFTALGEETDDDRLVAAAVIDLFQNGYVTFLENGAKERVVFSR